MRKEHELISIIIPVYNVERLLDRCVRSVAEQSYREIEIILIDDGSTDDCPTICDEWAAKDKRVRVIHKANEGQGLARNSGIEAAGGEYICFFDSDDYIVPGAIERAYSEIKLFDADILLWGVKRIAPDGSILSESVPQTKQTLYTGDEVRTLLLPARIAPYPEIGANTHIGMSAWACMYKAKIIRETGWRFVSEREIISEDYYSNLLFSKYVERAAILPEALYCYQVNAESFSQAYREDRYEKIKHCYDEEMKLCDELGYSERVKDALAYPYLSNTIGHLKTIIRSGMPLFKRYRLIEEVVKDKHMQEVLTHIHAGQGSRARRMLTAALRHRLSIAAYLMVALNSK